MRARQTLIFALIAASGCEGISTTKPDALSAGAPGFLISDGAHSGGNPDFFFLPPMVPDPTGSPNWNAGTFNGALKPTIKICSLAVTTEAAVATAPCAGSYSVTYNLPKASAGSEDYHQNWTVPVSSTTFYRISVLVGTKLLGSADIETGDNGGALKNVNTGQFVPLVDGRTLPIKFRIEQYALCSTPGVGPCGSGTVDLGTGGTVQIALPGGSVPSGVTIPAQPSNTTSPTITVQACPDLNDRATDLPTFGSCVRVTADPALPPEGLLNAASVFICDVGNSILGRVNSEAQEQRITLHRLDIDQNGQRVAALPHAPGCPLVVSSNTPSLRDLFATLRRGKVRDAAGQALAMLAPRPLYAATRRVDLGGGGFSLEFSDFQFALPAKFGVDASSDGQSAAPGSTLPIDPTVRVTDLGGEPVRGARVSFATTDGSVSSASVVTGNDGVAKTQWTIAPIGKLNTLRASGRGIGGSDNNGPRTGVDPFQPIQAHFDGYDAGGAVSVLTGTVALSATGANAPVQLLAFGSGGYSWLQLASTLLAPKPPQPTGWQQPTFDASAWTAGGVAPFGSPPGCAINGTVATFWLTNSDLLLRKSFSAPYAGVVTINLRVDNDAKVFLDGVDITVSGAPTVANSFLRNEGTTAPDNWWIHDNCADDGAPSFTANVSAGNHVLAVIARDRGGDSFADISMRLAPQ